MALQLRPKKLLTEDTPAEIRNHIWEILCQGDVGLQAIIHNQRAPLQHSCTVATSRKTPVSILLVCKQVYKEIQPFLYQSIIIRTGGALRINQAYPSDVSLILSRFNTLTLCLHRYTKAVDLIITNTQIDKMSPLILRQLLTLPKLKALKITMQIPRPKDKNFPPWRNASKHMPTSRIESLIIPLMAFDKLEMLTFDTQWINSQPWGWECKRKGITPNSAKRDSM